jgi:hypothetical protein
MVWRKCELSRFRGLLKKLSEISGQNQPKARLQADFG